MIEPKGAEKARINLHETSHSHRLVCAREWVQRAWGEGFRGAYRWLDAAEMWRVGDILVALVPDMRPGPSGIPGTGPGGPIRPMPGWTLIEGTGEQLAYHVHSEGDAATYPHEVLVAARNYVALDEDEHAATSMAEVAKLQARSTERLEALNAGNDEGPSDGHWTLDSGAQDTEHDCGPDCPGYSCPEFEEAETTQADREDSQSGANGVTITARTGDGCACGVTEDHSHSAYVAGYGDDRGDDRGVTISFAEAFELARKAGIERERTKLNDSGAREVKPSGFIREPRDPAKPNYVPILTARGLDIVPVELIQRIAEHYYQGGLKYEPDNWKRGTDPESLERNRVSAAGHFTDWLNGKTDEDHAIAALWNMITYEINRRASHGLTAGD